MCHKNYNFFTFHQLIWVKEWSYSATSNFLKCWANSGRESLILNKLKWVKPFNDIVKTTFLTHHWWHIDHQWPSHWVTLRLIVLNGCNGLNLRTRKCAKNVPRSTRARKKNTHTQLRFDVKPNATHQTSYLTIDRDEETQKDGVEGERQKNTTAKSPAFWIFLEEF